MSQLLFYYQRPEPATWVFLSSFLLISLYFVFHRFFSIRNMDIVLLLLLAPGLMMVYEGRRMRMADRQPPRTGQLVGESAMHQASEKPLKAWLYSQVDESDQSTSSAGLQADGAVGKGQSLLPESSMTLVATRQAGSGLANDAIANSQDGANPSGSASYPPSAKPKSRWSADALQFWGFVALLSACGLIMVRMLIDPALVRRPLLIPNLSIGGLSFIGISLFIFLMGNVITSTPREQELRSPQLGPGYLFLKMLPQLPTTPDAEFKVSEANAGRGLTVEPTGGQSRILSNLARVGAILSNLAIILSIVGVGYWHFDNVKTGIGCAVMYLLLPYTAQMTGNLEHVVPAAFMSLALLSYRQPLVCGLLMGLAAGLVYYPLFLLPLWISFYWKRGLTGWLTGVSAALVLLAGLLLIHGWQEFLQHLTRMFGLWLPRMEGLEGIWGPGRIQADFRLPVLVAFFLLSFSYAAWPSRKNLGTLISGTAAVMLAAQFWHGNGGGLYMAWFLPFVLLTIFRPNLDDRVATHVVYQRKQVVT